MKKITFLLTAFLAFSLSLSAQKKTVQVLALNDMHAYLDRAAALGGVIDSLRAINPNLLVLSAGDNRTGNPVNDMYSEPSRPMTEVMNAFGVNASALGNHEFDAKIAGFKKQAERSNFPYLCANVTVPDSMGFKLDPYKIFDVDGVKIGVIGILQINQRGIPDCLADNVKGLVWSNPQKAAEKYVDIVRKQCDIEILLSHNGIDEDKISAQNMPQFDAIMGGHTHTLVPANTIVNGVLITQSKNKMQYCTLVDFEVENGKVVKKSSKLISVLETTQSNKKIAEMVEKYSDNPFLQEVMGSLSKPIPNYICMGAFVSDGQRYGTKCQIALQNGGGVRYSTKEAGDFTRKDALMLDPFGNKMVVFKLSGADIKRLIADCRENDEMIECYTSGVSYTMKVDKNDPKKVKSLDVYLENGKPLKNKKLYSFACNNYVVSITFLKNREGKILDKTSCDCLIEYLKDKSPLDYSKVMRTNIIEE